jgi:hypothetical protein
MSGSGKSTALARLPSRPASSLDVQEGVDGSSLSEVSTKAPVTGLLISHRLCGLSNGGLGMEPFMEPSVRNSGGLGTGPYEQRTDLRGALDERSRKAEGWEAGVAGAGVDGRGRAQAIARARERVRPPEEAERLCAERAQTSWVAWQRRCSGQMSSPSSRPRFLSPAVERSR